MTKPIFEPTQPRKIGTVGWQAKQLQRRPDTTSVGAAGLDWGYNEDTGDEGLQLNSPNVGFDIYSIAMHLSLVATAIKLGAITGDGLNGFFVDDDGNVVIGDNADSSGGGATGPIKLYLDSTAKTMTLIIDEVPVLEFSNAGIRRAGGNYYFNIDSEQIDFSNPVSGHTLFHVRRNGHFCVFRDDNTRALGLNHAVGLGLEVRSSSGAILTVTPDGSMHGVTGKSLTFDL